MGRSLAVITARLLTGAALLATSGCVHNSVQININPNAAAQPGTTGGGMREGAVVTPVSDREALFTDVTAQSGIDYRWKITASRPLNILGTIGNGCAMFDYNGDGNLDILFVGPHLALYRGDGHGHFTDVTEETGLAHLHGYFLGCAVGDYDNDGFEDVYLTAYRGGALLHNERGKRFVDVTGAAGLKAQPWSTSASFVDVDNDGKLDLYLCNYAQFGPDTNPQLCDNAGVKTSCGPRYYQPERGVLYRNLGGGRFTDVTGAWGVPAIHGKGLGVAAADYDGSGHASLALANDEVEGDLLHNLGHKFKEIGAEAGTAFNNDGNVHGGMGIDWGDYDNDGKLDLAVATFQHEAKCVYHNDGNGLFSEDSAQLGMADRTLPYVSFGIKWLDYDNDGWLDLVFANGHVQDNIDQIDKSTTYRQPTVLLHNQGGHTFADVSAQGGIAFSRPIVGRGLAVGDFDNDGKIDILVVDGEGAPLLLHNQATGTGHWLMVKLIGTASNRDGIGALVTFSAGGQHMLRHCATDGSYMSASDVRVHCGLGAATSADVEVHWPSGRTERFQNLSADRIVTLKEGTGK